MFKKLKDKITEDIKDIKFPQSVQQLAQAVVSPSSSSNSSSFEPASNDNFSIGDDFDDTPQNSPLRKGGASEGGVAYRGGQATPLGKPSDAGSGAGFTLVDLQQNSSTPEKQLPGSGTNPGGNTSGFGAISSALSGLRSGSRRSSISSVSSDASFMFPSLETSGHTYNFQSDLESCSETSESVGPNVNKEQLLAAYQKIQQRYHKYKGRYHDLARHYRELERENTKAKNVLAECQDKALRRMAELKEQCNLEKQAKAHLEEALRSDLEEKDHLIHTLETKINLLKHNTDATSAPAQSPGLADVAVPLDSVSEEVKISGVSPTRQEDLLTTGDSGPTAAVLTPEPAVTDSERVLKEKNKKLESLLLKCREDMQNKREHIKQLESDKQAVSAQVDMLQQRLTEMQKREEEASLSLAKNKLTIHRELELKEEEIKKLSAQLTSCNTRISELQNEVVHIKEEAKKDLTTGKAEIIKQVQAELQELATQNKNLEETLATRDGEVASQEARAAQALQRLKETEEKLTALRETVDKNSGSSAQSQEEILALKEEVTRLQNSLESAKQSSNVIDRLNPCLQILKDLRITSSGLRKEVDSAFAETKSLVDNTSQLLESKINHILLHSDQELKKACKESEAYRQESEDAKEALEKLSDKVRTLDGVLMKEKSDVASKIALLEHELETEKSLRSSIEQELERSKHEAETKVSTLQQNLETEKVSRQTIELETKNKLTEMENELSEERNKLQKALEDTSSVEGKVKKVMKDLRQQIKTKVQENSKLGQELDTAKQNLQLVESEVSQLTQELDKLRKEAMSSKECDEVAHTQLEEKSREVEELKNNLEEVRKDLEQRSSENKSISLEKQQLQEKLSTVVAELEARLSDLRVLYELQRDAKDALEREKIDLEQRLSDSMERSEKEMLLYREEIESMQKIVDEKDILLLNVTKECESLKTHVSTLMADQAEVDLAKKKIDELKSSNEELNAKLMGVQVQLREKSEEVAQLNMKIQNTEEEVIVKTQAHLNSERGEFLKKLQEHDLVKENLHSDKEKLATAVKELQEEINKLKSLKCEVDERNEGLQSKLTDKEAFIVQLQSDIQGKVDEINQLIECKSKVEAEVRDKTEECTRLSDRVQALSVEMKSFENDNHQTSLLEEKTTECELLSSKLIAIEKEQSENSILLIQKTEQIDQLRNDISTLKADNAKLEQLLSEKSEEFLQVTSAYETLKKEHEEQCAVLESKIKECAEVTSKLEALNSDHVKTAQLLKQKTDECTDKKAQLDNLADEMKRVDELTEEFERISEESDANVQILTAEASNLAQKVEELTAKTQQMKEREVELLAKIEMAGDLETEYITMKQNESKLLEKIQLGENVRAELERGRDELCAKVKTMEEENERLREAEKSLLVLKTQAQETFAKCERLQQNEADLRARIEKAEETEMSFSLFEEQLRTLKEEKEQLVHDLEFAKSKSSAPVHKDTSSSEPLSSKEDISEEPVIEEPIIVKKFIPLVENTPDAENEDVKYSLEKSEWEEKYNRLLQEHKEASERNAAEIANLKDQYERLCKENDARPKERLWDRQDGTFISKDSSNGSFGTVERLQQQLATVTNQLKESKNQHRQEVSDLRRILLTHGSGNMHSMSRSDNLEDATELEYLRNILYEYMMGKEPMVLARVIAAVVKFDSDQTSKVLQKEQQRLSLVCEVANLDNWEFHDGNFEPAYAGSLSSHPCPIQLRSIAVLNCMQHILRKVGTIKQVQRVKPQNQKK